MLNLNKDRDNSIADKCYNFVKIRHLPPRQGELYQVCCLLFSCIPVICIQDYWLLFLCFTRTGKQKHMKIFTAAQIKACDAYTIHSTRISSWELMERAATACADWLQTSFPADALYVVLCGTGNNGGDGLAITRLLHQRGLGAKAFLVRMSNDASGDCLHNLQRLQQLDKSLINTVEPETYLADIPEHIIIVDAILGTGLSRPATGWLASFLRQIDHLPNRKIAIDIPSGLPADSIPEKDTAIIAADDTLSFQFYKRSFLHDESAHFAGNVHILDIGLSDTYIGATHSQYTTIDAATAKQLYKPRLPWTHKGSFGSALLVGGSYGKIGAISLSTQAALRAGAGLVFAQVPTCGYSILQTTVPEAMCRTNGDHYAEQIADWEKMNAIGIGPGLGTHEDTASALELFIEACKMPVVFDADALNIIAAKPELLGKLPSNSVLTPHPKEFTRLFGSAVNTMSMVDHARMQAMRYNINIVLKGHHTAVISAEGACHYNMTGNAGMATGGSGDVLTGIITGLIAQGYDPADAAVLGVYLHGLAGDLAAAELSMEAMIAGDIARYLGKAFLTLY